MSNFLAESNLNLDLKSVDATPLLPPSFFLFLSLHALLALHPCASCSFAFDVFNSSLRLADSRVNLSIFHPDIYVGRENITARLLISLFFVAVLSRIDVTANRSRKIFFSRARLSLRTL